MFDNLEPPRQPAVMRLMQEFAADPRSQKIDLGIGVYKNEAGETPVMSAISKAEAMILRDQKTKTYQGLAGDLEFARQISKIILGTTGNDKHLESIHTPGGSGALRLLFDLIKKASPDAIIWLPDPSWANHLPVVQEAGLVHKTYRYFDASRQCVDFDGLMADLEMACSKDVVLLHGCCHNPTGADLTADQWEKLAALARHNAFTPLIDLAYQGFAQGLDQDASGTRTMVDACRQTMIAASCSKNFAIYRERAGIALFASDEKPNTEAVGATMKNLARVSYSMPPAHGAAIVNTVLSSKELRAEWERELARMRKRLNATRSELAAALRAHTNSSRFDFVANQFGMFSLSGLAPEMVQRLREEYAIYLIPDGRMNIAGLQSQSIEIFAKAISELTRNQ